MPACSGSVLADKRLAGAPSSVDWSRDLYVAFVPLEITSSLAKTVEFRNNLSTLARANNDTNTVVSVPRAAYTDIATASGHQGRIMAGFDVALSSLDAATSIVLASFRRRTHDGKSSKKER